MRFTQNIDKSDYQVIGDQINAHRLTKQQSPLKMSSINQYCSNYNIISKLCDYKTEDETYFLADYDRVISSMNKNEKPLSENTKRNYLNSVITMSQTCDIESSIIQKFVDDRDGYNKKYNDKKEAGEVFSEEEMTHQITQNDIIKVLIQIRKEVKGLDAYRPKSEITKKTYNLLQFYTLLSLYSQHRLRNDFASLQVITKRDYNALEDKTGNYLLVKGRDISIVLNDYKTNKDGTEKVIDITDKKLITLLKNYIKVIGTNTPLFTGPTDLQMTSNQLTVFLQKYTKEYLGKKVSTRLLRKIFYTEKYGHLINELKKDATDNLHSTGTAMNIYTASHGFIPKTVSV